MNEYNEQHLLSDTNIKILNDIDVKLVRAYSAYDNTVVQAAQVSAKGENNSETDAPRLIRSLMAHRHGSPFEHNSMTFFVKAPIFVIREWQRHRMSSFNELSGRYSVLNGEFYIPSIERKMINYGTNMVPKFAYDRNGAGHLFINILLQNTIASWNAYVEAIELGISNEAARMVLPVNIYSQMYWTVNARSLMNFLSLRVQSDDSLVKSYPQYEIDLAAQKFEALFSELMPVTHQAFVENGRVAP